MALEELIVEWSRYRPAWQRDTMRRAAAGDELSDEDYDELVVGILAPEMNREVTFQLEHFPQATAADPSVRLLSISKPEHVNALASSEPLTFEPNGLTIVYGDNGSGKSGYARLLKRIARSRIQEEILTDVFRDTSLEKPAASLVVQIGDRHEPCSWPDSTPPELQRMLFFDAACGDAYIATESDFPYRPSALAVMDALISACVAVRARIDTKLDENTKSAATLPVVADEVRATAGGTYLSQLSGSASLVTLDSLVKEFDTASETIEVLKTKEARLRSSDPSKERQALTRQSEKLDALAEHLDKVHTHLGDGALSALQTRRDDLSTLDEAASLAARSFESEPLQGVGRSPWKVLWESAKQFSEEHAYPAQPFPVLDDGSRCVLCQQTLDTEARERLSGFEEFVRDDTQVRLGQARKLYETQANIILALAVSPDGIVSAQKDLEATHANLMAECSAILEKYQKALDQTIDVLAGDRRLLLFGIDPLSTLARLREGATAARELSAALSDPDSTQQQLLTTTARRQEMELLQEIKNSREAIGKEILRRRELKLLETAKTAAATGPITKKILELSEESITEVVRDAFTRETARLRLERVTIARTRADKGALLHRPKLVGARQDAKLPRVLSEGERTALGLSALFTEVQLDGSKSALILDDPVTSLDHIRRGLVAARLVELAENRQVILFTHDVAFVADLKREAKAKGVDVADRSVTRSRADEGKPGACSTKHPWKAKDVAQRLEELRRDLRRIKKECAAWEDKTYEDAVAVWAGNLSEIWERIFSQEIVGPLLAEGGLEVRPMMVKILARFSEEDYREFDGCYSRVSQWVKRHDKSTMVNYVPPDCGTLNKELDLVDSWFKRVKGYKA